MVKAPRQGSTAEQEQDLPAPRVRVPSSLSGLPSFLGK